MEHLDPGSNQRHSRIDNLSRFWLVVTWVILLILTGSYAVFFLRGFWKLGADPRVFGIAPLGSEQVPNMDFVIISIGIVLIFVFLVGLPLLLVFTYRGTTGVIIEQQMKIDLARCGLHENMLKEKFREYQRRNSWPSFLWPMVFITAFLFVMFGSVLLHGGLFGLLESFRGNWCTTAVSQVNGDFSEKGKGNVDDEVQNSIIWIDPNFEYLFLIEHEEYIKILDRGTVSKGIRSQFDDHQIHLSPDANVRVDVVSKFWMIEEGSSTYRITNVGGTLNVYTQRSIVELCDTDTEDCKCIFYKMDVPKFFRAMAENATILIWAVIGAYVHLLMVLVRRWLQTDLTAGTLWRLNQRFATVFFLGLLLMTFPSSGTFASGTSTPASGYMSVIDCGWTIVAFITGIVPDDFLRWLNQFFKSKLKMKHDDPAKTARDGPFGQSKLENSIEGIDFWQAERLFDEGIETIQALAMKDIPSLLIRIRVDGQRLLNWVDQALLFSQVGDQMDSFKKAHILTASDLIMLAERENNGIGRIWESINDATDNLASSGPVTEKMLENVIFSLKNGPNLCYLQAYWKNTPQPDGELEPRYPEKDGPNANAGDVQ